MGVTLNVYKNKIQRIINETLEEKNINELFDTLPFKNKFNFEENNDEIYSKFQDPSNNQIRVIFHKNGNETYLLDFTMNGNSRKDYQVNYSLKEYTSLLSTIAKSVSQFLGQYEPKAIRIDGEDAFEKIYKTQNKQKINIYNYFINNMDNNENYSIQYSKNGNFDLIRKNI